jgi:hypothetical protein
MSWRDRGVRHPVIRPPIQRDEQQQQQQQIINSKVKGSTLASTIVQ